MSRTEGAMAALKAQTKIKNHAEEMGNYLKDMHAWEKNIKLKGRGLKSKPKARKVPPVRASGGLIPVGATATLPQNPVVKQNRKSNKPEVGAANHTYDKGYKKWEKFDVDAALVDVDKVGEEEEEEKEDIVQIQTPATMVVHSKQAIPQVGVTVAKPKPALKTPGEREADERQKGNELFQKGDFHKAIKAYTACLGISNRSVLAFSNRAMCWLKLKEWRKAETDATLALQVDSTHVKSYQRRAAARNALGLHRSALGDLSEALEYASADKGHLKALNMDMRKTKELLRSAMRNAPRRSVQIMVDYGPTLPPVSSDLQVKEKELFEDLKEDKPQDIQMEEMKFDEGVKKDASEEITSKQQGKDMNQMQEEDNEVVVDIKNKSKVRASSTIKLTYSSQDKKEDNQDNDDDDEDEKANRLTPGNMMNFKYDPQLDKETPETEPQLKSSLSASSTSLASSSKTKSTKSSNKIPDPKGPFEMERLWRSCGKDEKLKLKLAKKWFRSDGKVAIKIFGTNKSNLGNSCPLDSDILCDVLLYRLKPFLNHENNVLSKQNQKSKETYEEFMKSLEILFKQPKFKSSIDFLSVSNISSFDEILKSCNNKQLVEVMNRTLHP